MTSRDRIRRQNLRSRYGLTLEEFEAMASAQDYRCAICHERRSLVVDHCHLHGVTRGLLCSECNSGIGKLKDAPPLLARSLLYLAAHGSALSSEQLAEFIGAYTPMEDDA